MTARSDGEPSRPSIAVQRPSAGQLRAAPAGSGSESRTCDSAVSGIMTPEIVDRNGEKRLDQPVHVGGALRCREQRVLAPARTASGGNSAPSAPVIWISPLDCIANERPSERKSTSGLASVEMRAGAATAGTSSPLPGLRARSTPIDPGRPELALDHGPSPAPGRPGAGPTKPARTRPGPFRSAGDVGTAGRPAGRGRRRGARHENRPSSRSIPPGAS